VTFCITAFIWGVTYHDTGPETSSRATAKLAEAGWPLAGYCVPMTNPERTSIAARAVEGGHASNAEM